MFSFMEMILNFYFRINRSNTRKQCQLQINEGKNFSTYSTSTLKIHNIQNNDYITNKNAVFKNIVSLFL